MEERKGRGTGDSIKGMVKAKMTILTIAVRG